MSAPPPVITIGDAIIDAVQTSGAAALYPGGAALNLAVGLARLGLASALAAQIGRDRDGFRLMRYLREEGVRLINTPNADFTGVAMSQRRDGEPSYDFTPSLYRRPLRSIQPFCRRSPKRRRSPSIPFPTTTPTSACGAECRADPWRLGAAFLSFEAKIEPH